MGHSQLSTSSYNISLSLNFTSLLTFPARLFARMRKVDDLLTEDTVQEAIATTLTSMLQDQVDWSSGSEIRIDKSTAGMSSTAMPSTSTVTTRSSRQHSSGFQPSFPGPWGFFTSGYCVGLFMMAILLHRIQNIVVPPRGPILQHPNRRTAHGPVRDIQVVDETSRRGYAGHRITQTAISQGHALVRTLYSHLLPLNLTRTSTRLTLHLPSLYFLSKMLLLWTLILLQTSNILSVPEAAPAVTSTTENWSWVNRLCTWSSNIEMEELCWKTFCAVCAAFCVEALVKGLDGAGVGLTAHMNSNTSPFNLVGYAFLLHIYSSPITHANKYENSQLPSRPDKHVVVTITIPLLQLTIFHFLSVRKRWSQHRLFPTALASFLSLAHFHMTLWSHSRLSSSHTSYSNDTAATSPTSLPNSGAITGHTNSHSLSSNYLSYQHYPPHANYPLLNYIPNIFESLLLLTTFLTITLNALTQLLLTGRVDRPLVGLGLGGSSGGWTWNPPYDEDFGVLLLRVGTASLEATGLRGWGNEVGGIVMPAARSKTNSPTNPGQGKTYGRMGITRAGVLWMHNASTTTTIPKDGVMHRERHGPGHGRMKGRTGMSLSTEIHQGWANEVRDVNASTSLVYPSTGWWYSGIGVGGIGVDWRWYRELFRFGVGVWGVCKGVTWHVWSIARRWRARRSVEGEGEEEALDMEGEELQSPDRQVRDEGWQDEVYQKFLRGELSDDAEDENHEWDEEDERTMYRGNPSDEDVDEQNEEVDDGTEGVIAETVTLYSDLAHGVSHSSSWPSRQVHRSPSPYAMEHGDSSSASGASNAMPVLLAHMMHEGTPLTRRRYLSYMTSSEGSDELRGGSPSYSKLRQRARSRTPLLPDDSRRNCVICTVEPRQIICWPCRCLALCDECRESLASRSSASKHRCPCCRRIVEGYSRLFIP